MRFADEGLHWYPYTYGFECRQYPYVWVINKSHRDSAGRWIYILLRGWNMFRAGKTTWLDDYVEVMQGNSVATLRQVAEMNALHLSRQQVVPRSARA